MSFSPSEETLVASTSKNQLYSITMSLTEISKVSVLQQHLLPHLTCAPAAGLVTRWVNSEKD